MHINDLEEGVEISILIPDWKIRLASAGSCVDILLRFFFPDICKLEFVTLCFDILRNKTGEWIAREQMSER